MHPFRETFQFHYRALLIFSGLLFRDHKAVFWPTFIVSFTMKQRDTKNMVQKVISERPATEQETNVETKDNGEGGNE